MNRIFVRGAVTQLQPLPASDWNPIIIEGIVHLIKQGMSLLPPDGKVLETGSVLIRIILPVHLIRFNLFHEPLGLPQLLTLCQELGNARPHDCYHASVHSMMPAIKTGFIPSSDEVDIATKPSGMTSGSRHRTRINSDSGLR